MSEVIICVYIQAWVGRFELNLKETMRYPRKGHFVLEEITKSQQGNQFSIGSLRNIIKSVYSYSFIYIARVLLQTIVKAINNWLINDGKQFVQQRSIANK